MAHSKRWLIIINPTSGSGSGRRKWSKIEDLLKSNQFDFKYVFTEYSNHSSILVHDAISNGFRNIICVGGDGTIHNVINGIMSQDLVLTSEINLGVIPIGTGNDWVKTYGIPKNLDCAIQVIKKGGIKYQDIGKLQFFDPTKNPVFFNNLAGIGFDGYVVSKVKKLKRFGAFAYILGALLGIASAKNFKAKIAFNSEFVTTNVLMVLVGLCKYSGGGMKLTKDPDPKDGYLDLTIVQDFTAFDVLLNLFKLFNGTVTNSKKVITSKTISLAIEINDNSTPFVQADGELIGRGGFAVSLIPRALSFYR